MIYRYIYKITCTTGRYKDHFYYGQHTTENLDDEYKGSGKLIKDYYKKHPNDYVKEIIAFYNDKNELNQAEKDIINKYLNDKKCLNIALGGMGGNTYIPRIISIETRKKLSESQKRRYEKTPFSEESKNKISKANKGKSYRGTGWHHSEETKRKIGNLAKQRQPHLQTEETKTKLSKTFNCYVHIHNGIIEKFINKDMLDFYLSNGYVRGRLKKKSILN